MITELDNLRLDLLKIAKDININHYSVNSLIDDADKLYEYVLFGKQKEVAKCCYPEKDLVGCGYLDKEYHDGIDEVVSEKENTCEVVDLGPWNTEEFFKLCNSFKNDLSVFQCSNASTDFSKEENRKNFYDAIFKEDSDVDKIKEYLTPTRLVNYAHTPTNEAIEGKWKDVKSLPEKPFQLGSIYENMCKDYIRSTPFLPKKVSYFDQWSKERDEKLAKEKAQQEEAVELRATAAEVSNHFKEIDAHSSALYKCY